MGKFEVQNVDSVKMYKIRKTLEELTQHSGRGTELITVYIPKGQQLHEVMTQLREEQGTADNIKSDLTRTHVVDSLSKVQQRLKLYKKTPEKGLVVFRYMIEKGWLAESRILDGSFYHNCARNEELTDSNEFLAVARTNWNKIVLSDNGYKFAE